MRSVDRQPCYSGRYGVNLDILVFEFLDTVRLRRKPSAGVGEDGGEMGSECNIK